MNIDFKGRTAIVCGSSQGIGKAVAIDLANSGAGVTLIARDEESLKQVLGELSKDDNQTHQYICVDFGYPEKLKSMIEEYVGGNPPVHILVNNTGGPPPGLIFDAAQDAFDESILSATRYWSRHWFRE
jgi:3-oxoacyl-[acyl-carrier protein] reductase